MAKSDCWIKEFRKAIKSKIGSGWQVSNDRGNIRLLNGSKETGRTSINLPFSWQENQWIEAFKFIKIGADVFRENNWENLINQELYIKNYLMNINMEEIIN